MQRPVTMWYAVYEIDGCGTLKAGPWLITEAEEQARDIAGYEGVKNLRLEPTSQSEE